MLQPMLNSLLPCKFIYSIDYQHGTLFALALSKQTYVGPMEDQILFLDKSMQASCGSTSTRFTSISDRLSGKIKTFGKGEYMSDEHYTAIFPTEAHFARKGQTVRVHSGVRVWSSPLNAAEPEFDVVKKRRAMDNAELETGESSDAAALAAFEDFERSVLPALELIQMDEDTNRKLEVLQFEDDVINGKPITAGGVYFAWSNCLRCMKIGATRRENPQQRLSEISRYVTERFILAAWIPTPTPFRLEAAAHLHFKEQRMNQRGDGSGAGTEFFRIAVAEAETYVAMATA